MNGRLQRRYGSRPPVAAIVICVFLWLVAACGAGSGSGANIKSSAVPGDTVLVCNGSTSPCPKVAHFDSLQSAVNAARPGDWVLIWPGVYHEDDQAHNAGVWITTPGLHIRGMNRNTVIIDGSHGSASHPCPASQALQDFTPRDGIVVWNASGVTIENLTVCDYLAGPGAVHGSQIWWTGNTGDENSTGSGQSGSYGGYAGSSDWSDNSGELGLGAFGGSYLTTTSMYHPSDVKNQHLAEFGIFVGGASGPGQITNSYASNMANAAFYIGACQRSCNTTLADDEGTGSAAGYLGTNSGGILRISSSSFTDNRTGLVFLSLNTDDLPPPQDGRCPNSSAGSCTVITGNDIDNNNNASAPAFGITPAIGIGIEVQGGSYDTITGNRITNQGSWGVLVADNVDELSTESQSHCQGGVPDVAGNGTCLFPARGNRVDDNVFAQDGTFGNQTNGDLGMLGLSPTPAAPRNCFYGNTASGGPLTSSPARIETAAADGAPCGALPGTGENTALLQQLGCADGTHCATRSARYPVPVTIGTVPLPALPTMPDPCAGIPRNAFCQAGT